MLLNLADLTITSIETISVFDVLTGAYKFVIDELQSATLAQSQDETEITGKQGRRIATLKRNKTITVSGNNGLISGGLLELQTGGSFNNGVTNVMWTDYLTVNSNEATTTYKAVGTTGAEIKSLYIKENGIATKELEQAATTADGKFAYAPATKKLTFTGITDGTEIAVLYERKITADTLENVSDKYSGVATLYIDALAQDKCSNIYRVQIYIPKADFKGELSLEMGDNQTVHAFEATALAGACGGSSSLWTYTVFGANTEDEA